jgi:Complex 1 protein (LYR family)
MREVLALYRHFLRVARKMPTEHRQHYIARAARARIERSRNLQDPTSIAEAVALGHVLLEQAAEQAAHLQACHQAGLLDAELVDPPAK